MTTEHLKHKLVWHHYNMINLNNIPIYSKISWNQVFKEIMIKTQAWLFLDVR